MVTSPKLNPTGAQAPEPEADTEEIDCNWTADQVSALMRKAMSRESGIAWMVSRRSIEAVGILPPSAEKVKLWLHRYLTEKERKAFAMWAMADAWKANGTSRAEFMREMNWDEPPSTISRRKKRAADKIAKCLRRDRIPIFSL